MIHKRSTALERSVKYFTGGFKPVSLVHQEKNLLHQPEARGTLCKLMLTCICMQKLIKIYQVVQELQAFSFANGQTDRIAELL